MESPCPGDIALGANDYLCGSHTVERHLPGIRAAHCRFHEMARQLRVGNRSSGFSRCAVVDVRHLRKVVPGAFAERSDRGIPRLLSDAECLKPQNYYNGRDW